MEVLRPLRSLREIKDNSVFVLHAECAKSAEIYSLPYSTLALEGRKLRYDERAQRCAVSGERGAEEQIFMFMFVVSGNCIIFAMNSVATAVV